MSEKKRWLDSEFNRMTLPTDVAMILLPILMLILWCFAFIYVPVRLEHYERQRQHSEDNRIPPVKDSKAIPAKLSR